MKPTVFRITEPDGTAHLVCVRTRSLQAAFSLEAQLRTQAGRNKEIKLLGRFDAVHAALSQQEAEALILGEIRAPLTLEEVVDRVLLRTRRT